ncbi:MAG: DUF1015 family protein [Methanolinea sp.]|nr:DUF1015 family protein [Methanolinea sp.]
MVEIFRFAAVRPGRVHAPRVAAVPYDVVTREEAAEIIRENPSSFLRVSRADAELADVPPYDGKVYERARENFRRLIAEGIFSRDDTPGMYLYRVTGNGNDFLGLCCTVSTRDYEENTIRRHELTRVEKEEDRTRHIDTVNAHTGPVVLLYVDGAGISRRLRDLWERTGRVDTEVPAPDGTVHRIVRVTDGGELAALEEAFRAVPRLYIADGHHRAKSAVNVAEKRRAEGRLTPEATRFLGVLFPHDGVKIHGYSRLVTDLGGMDDKEFLGRLGERFAVRPCEVVDPRAFHVVPRAGDPERFHVFHVFLGGKWYECSRPRGQGTDAIGSLDVTVLQQEVLGPILGISDPRTDPRLQYLGGARPLRDLMEMVTGGRFALAIAMQPVRVETVIAIADAGGIMPPKSTWFEPKLLSGLLVHAID